MMKRRKSHLLATVAALAAVAALSAGCGLRAPFVPRDVRKLRPQGRVYLVPIGEAQVAAVDELAGFYRRKYALPVEVVPPTRVPPAAYDARRRQLVAEELTAVLGSQFLPAGEGRRDVVIGVTGDDMYIRGVKWNYAFSYRRERVAVVSSARMDHAFMGLWAATAERQRSRLRKMVTKNIGVLYYGLPLSDHPRSVLYRKVGGPQELDRMGEDF